MTRFAVDTMLGTLAKWLRALGYDTLYVPHADDGELLAIAEKEGRTILTRDRELASRAGDGGFLVPGGALDEQLVEVAKRFPERDSEPLSRCLECNGALSAATKDDALASRAVPEGVMERFDEFWRCPSCKKVYWKGSHYAAMQSKVETILRRAG
jgi:hypothetical protein